MPHDYPYEVFDHTADVGINAYGDTLAALFIHAAQGMESLMVPPEQVRGTTSREITAQGHDLVSLLVEWLNELVYLFDTEHLLFCDFAVEAIDETHVVGRAFGEPYDVLRHDIGSAIKAVTWHEAAVKRTESGYQARIIFDI
ncbi:MAG TPA: archease [Ktedonobacteraceae bacterium]|jgi:SHS2 domain-containing protein